MKLAIFANFNHPGLINFKQSVQPGWELVHLGKDAKWEGWKTRMTHYRDFCRTLPRDEVVVFSDAFDALCVRGAQDFLTDFSKLERPIVVSGVVGYYPGNTRKTPKVKVSGTARHVNAGLVAGQAGELASMYDWGLQHCIADDQLAVCAYINTYPEKCALDGDRALFFNDEFGCMSYTFHGDHSITVKGQLRRPYVIHFPGLNVPGSIPILHWNLKKAPNYDIVGKVVNGKDQVIFTDVDVRAYLPAIWGERALYWSIILLVVLGYYLKHSRWSCYGKRSRALIGQKT